MPSRSPGKKAEGLHAPPRGETDSCIPTSSGRAFRMLQEEKKSETSLRSTGKSRGSTIWPCFVYPKKPDEIAQSGLGRESPWNVPWKHSVWASLPRRGPSFGGQGERGAIELHFGTWGRSFPGPERCRAVSYVLLTTKNDSGRLSVRPLKEEPALMEKRGGGGTAQERREKKRGTLIVPDEFWRHNLRRRTGRGTQRPQGHQGS